MMRMSGKDTGVLKTSRVLIAFGNFPFLAGGAIAGPVSQKNTKPVWGGPLAKTPKTPVFVPRQGKSESKKAAATAAGGVELVQCVGTNSGFSL